MPKFTGAVIKKTADYRRIESDNLREEMDCYLGIKTASIT
jgi:hypothetical protein